MCVHLHAADPDCALDDRAQWAKANPTLGSVKSIDYMVDAARRAMATPLAASGFRGHDLNQAIAPERIMICEIDDWRACETEDLPERRGPVYVGADMGGPVSLSAATMYWPASGRFELACAIGDDFTPAERGARDGVGDLYLRAVTRGELTLHKGRLVDGAKFMADLAGRLDGAHIAALGVDRYRRQELVTAMHKVGLAWPVHSRGTGFFRWSTAHTDIVAFQRAVLERKLRCAPSLMMRNAIAESSIEHDTRGNLALGKARHRGRIDPLQAGVISLGLASAGGEEHVEPRVFAIG